jgi:hypothetical protein
MTHSLQPGTAPRIPGPDPCNYLMDGNWRQKVRPHDGEKMNPSTNNFKALEAKWGPVLQKAGVSPDETKRFLLQVYKMLIN